MIKICRLLAATVIGSSLVVGCASHQQAVAATTSYASDGTVNAEIVAAPEGKQYEVSPGVAYMSPEPTPANAMPSYPAELLVQQLAPVQVVARIIVNESGLVESASIVQASSSAQEFSEATLASVKTWSFSPLKRVTGTNAEAIPFTQEYRFTFRQVNGRAIVESSARH